MRTNTRALFVAALLAAGSAPPPISATNEDATQRANLDSFRRAETDTYFAKFAQDGSLGKFIHQRDVASVDNQVVIRMNRDTLYSQALFDLDAGPVTVTLPDSGARFMAMQMIDQDHYTPAVIYAAGAHTFRREQGGTRYLVALIRIFANPNDPADMQAVHKLQDAIRVEQKSAGKFETPAWDQASLKQLRDALNALTTANGGLDSARMFGRRDQVDPVQHLLGTAAGWGGNPRETALYVGGVPPAADGKTAYTLTVKDVPVDGFWSVSVYNKEGFFEKNAKGAYTFNSVTARPNPDGSTTIRFGGDEKAQNMLPITPGWNYLVRLYRPRPEILDGTWKFPEPVEQK